MLFFAGVGCIELSGSSAAADGGVWKTVDRGDHWLSKKTVLTAAGLGTLTGKSIASLEMDPQDRQAVYAGTSTDGLFYSYDGGDSWTQAKQLSAGAVTSIAVDPKNKCSVYATVGQRVWKTTDCSRTFASAYYDARSNVGLTDVEVDWFNSNTVYVGTSAGDLLKSADGGANWASIQRFEDKIMKIYIDPSDSRILLVGLRDNGVWKSSDAGAKWTQLKEGLKDLGNGRGLVTIAGDAKGNNTYFVAAKYGILKTTDGGTSWKALNLPTPPESVIIYSLAINPANGNEIYYGTSSTFYRSLNGGANWTTKKLPTSRAATSLLVDQQDSKIIYMGTTQLKK